MLHTLALKSAMVDSRSDWSLPPCRLQREGAGGRGGRVVEGGWVRAVGMETMEDGWEGGAACAGSSRSSIQQAARRGKRDAVTQPSPA